MLAEIENKVPGKGAVKPKVGVAPGDTKQAVKVTKALVADENNDPENACVIVATGSVGEGNVRKRKPGRRWTKLEDQVLKELVEQYGNRHWKRIAKEFENRSGTARSDVQCLHRWNKCLKPGLIKGPWTPEEDRIICEMIAKHGVNNVRWSVIAKTLPGRLGKQVRERWINHLDPTIVKTEWTAEEDKNLHELQQKFGNRWKWIAELMPGRSENGVKNRWHSIKPGNGDKKSPSGTRATKGKAVKKEKQKEDKNKAPIKHIKKTTSKSLKVETGQEVNKIGKRSRPTNTSNANSEKIAEQAHELLRLSENYKAIANMMLSSGGNGIDTTQLAQAIPPLPVSSSKRIKLSKEDICETDILKKISLGDMQLPMSNQFQTQTFPFSLANPSLSSPEGPFLDGFGGSNSLLSSFNNATFQQLQQKINLDATSPNTPMLNSLMNSTSPLSSVQLPNATMTDPGNMQMGYADFAKFYSTLQNNLNKAPSELKNC